jgi:hypothetical protein
MTRSTHPDLPAIDRQLAELMVEKLPQQARPYSPFAECGFSHRLVQALLSAG